MTKPRPLGNDAAYRLNEAAMRLINAIKILAPFFEERRTMTMAERLYRVSQAVREIQGALIEMQAIGAKVRLD